MYDNVGQMGQPEFVVFNSLIVRCLSPIVKEMSPNDKLLNKNFINKYELSCQRKDSQTYSNYPE